MGSVGPDWDNIGLTRLSAGVGARIRVPFLPQLALAIDFGWAIQSETFDQTQVFSFNFGNF